MIVPPAGVRVLVASARAAPRRSVAGHFRFSSGSCAGCRLSCITPGSAETRAAVDTTRRGDFGSGADISFAGTVGGGAPRLDDLRLIAGSKGDVVFARTVSDI